MDARVCMNGCVKAWCVEGCCEAMVKMERSRSVGAIGRRGVVCQVCVHGKKVSIAHLQKSI